MGQKMPAALLTKGVWMRYDEVLENMSNQAPEVVLGLESA